MHVSRAFSRRVLLTVLPLGIAALSVLLLNSRSMAHDQSEDRVVMVGLDSMGKSVTSVVPSSTYRRNLALAFGSVHDSILPVLEKQDKREGTKHSTESGNLGWHLNSIGVGVGISGQFGLGPIINVTPTAQLKLVFTNSLSPVYPD